jgi:deoxyadenosine/deoxycytidine kinase
LIRSRKLSYVLVTGPMGSGKTTCARGLGAELSATVVEELFEDNTHLASVLAPSKRVAEATFASQSWFLEQFARSHRRARELRQTGGVVQDHSLHDAHNVVDAVMRDIGWLTREHFARLEAQYRSLAAGLDPPDAIVLLTASPIELHRRVLERKRPFERDVELSYLEQLTSASLRWWRRWERGVVLEFNAEQLDVRTKGGVDVIAASIRSAVQSKTNC